MLHLTVTDIQLISNSPQGIAVIEQGSEDLYTYVNIITFGIDVAAGIIGGISSLIAIS